ncbi:SusD/RagB family nutrient-binding outer membrane lipoprotein [Flavihumibacter solisilvae]|uniref:SusD/RagB family nutrient-binding outer membrane lipoprotein n=1 Tax=Flavihumibacter solisilvae TaxID=1349421 RepID=A0A0C1L789_9BACT|nr:SusD/RagB family nutrient-binding outer membrane lipoprotein [Flavihumibacter solisilvae]KIC95376.1 hypothetical protein OI18_06630 [Flavihumibacter solisilvae]
MKKIFIIISAFLVLVAPSCTKNLNDPQKQATVVPPGSLLTNAEKEFADAMTTPNVNSNIFRLLAQQWAQTTYPDESQYDLNTRNIPQNFWNAIYRDVLKDLNESTKLVNEDQLLDPVVKANQLAMNEILTVHAYSVLVNTYGDIPYTQALTFENLQPQYDDAATVMDDLLARLTAAISSINVDEEGFGDADLFYGGDMAQWVKYGNSLKLKLGMLLADVDEGKARAAVESAVAGGVFTSSADDLTFQYLGAPPNHNPVWEELVQSGRNDFVAANTFLDALVDIDDPRLGVYFTEVPDVGGYKGGIYGTNNNYNSYSQPSEASTEPDFPSPLLTYYDVEFLLAEAVERGFAVGGSAEEHYNNALTNAMASWGVPVEDISSYLANPQVNYATASGDWREKIGMQKWFALYDRGWEAWTEWRRFDVPDLVAPPTTVEPIPWRYTYPVAEQNLNTANWESAKGKLPGGLDKTNIKLFWDVN